MNPSFGHRDPDARGYYGAYGGRFVPETLVAPGRGARARVLRGSRGRDLPRHARRAAARLRGTPHAAVRSPPAFRVARWRARLSQARGPRAHGGAQNQQRARAGAARQADGKAARDRRDRRGTARRRDGDGLCAPGARLRSLHGRGRHGAPVAERLPDAAPRRDGPARGRRRAHVEGRHQRGDARLGHQRRRQLLPARIRPRAAPVSAHGSRVPVRHRAGSARPVSRHARPAPRRHRRLRRRRQQRHGHLRRVHRGCRRSV